MHKHQKAYLLIYGKPGHPCLWVGTGPVMIYRAEQLMRFFLPMDERTNRQTEEQKNRRTEELMDEQKEQADEQRCSKWLSRI